MVDGANQYLRRDFRRRMDQVGGGAAHAVLDLLTHAAQTLDEARELAGAAGLEIVEQMVQRSGVVAAGAIEALTQPLTVRVAGVLQQPIKSIPVPTGGGR